MYMYKALAAALLISLFAAPAGADQLCGPLSTCSGDPLNPADGTQNINGNLTVDGLIEQADNTTEGNFKTLRSNDVDLVVDPTCANKGTTGAGFGDLTRIDINEADDVERFALCEGDQRAGFIKATQHAFATIFDNGVPADTSMCPVGLGDLRVMTSDHLQSLHWCFAPHGWKFRIFSFGATPNGPLTENLEDWDLSIIYLTDGTAALSGFTTLDYADLCRCGGVPRVHTLSDGAVCCLG